MIETVRARLTLWYVTALAAVLIVVGGLIYVLLARALYARIDDNLQGVMQIAMTSLANDLAEGQDTEDAARSTAAELSPPGSRCWPSTTPPASCWRRRGATTT